MSLLLQALQKAAKNRESSAPSSLSEAAPSSPPEPEPVEVAQPPSFGLESSALKVPSESELSLEEDLFEPEELSAAVALEQPSERFEPFATAVPSGSAQAAAILRATETPMAGRIDWIRDHPVHAFAGLAGVFMLFYGGYVYLQLFHPALLRGDFLSKPFAAQTPPPPAQPIKPPPAAGAQVPAAASGQGSPATVPLSAGTPAGGPPVVAAGGPITGLPGAATANPMPATAANPPPPAPAKSVAASSPREAAARPANAPARPRAPARAMAMSGAGGVEDNLARSEVEPGATTVSVNMTRAYQALQDGKLEQAESLYRDIIQSDPQNVDAMLGLATIAAQRGNAQQAIGFYERTLELEPRNPVAQAGLISIIGQADPQISETRLKQLIAREPSPFLYFNLGNLYARQDQWAPAQGAYFQAYQMQPDSPDYAYNLAIGLEHLNQPKLALTYYRKALELSFQKGHANFDQNRVIERIGQLSARVD